jgi:hypothetical protein
MRRWARGREWLPPGYRLDASDGAAWVLRRSDGTATTYFGENSTRLVGKRPSPKSSPPHERKLWRLRKSRAGAFLRQARSGERDPKEGVGETPLERRHAMIAEAKEDHPDISERDLCRMFSVSRSWYYTCV